MKRSFVRSFRLFMLLLSAMVAGGCESVTITAVEIVVVRVSPLQIVVFVDATERLSARAQDASGNSLTGRTITWSSTNSSVASVDASGLVRGIAAGTATIRATAEGVVGSAEVTVILRPSIVLSVSEVQLESDFAGEPTESVPIEISNGTTGTLSELQIGVSYPSGGPQGWVETDLSSTTAPATLSIRAIPTALPAGTHEAEVEVRSAVAGNSPQAIRVVLEVGEAPPSVEVSSEVVSFASDAGQAGPPSQVLTVTNGGGGDLTGIEAAIEYEPGSGDGWLQTSLDGTTAPAQLTVVADPQGLAPGVYDAVITVTAAGAPGSVAEVRVRFRFGSPPPEIEIVPASLPWEILEATPINPPRSVQVANRGTGTLGSLTLEVTYGPGGASGWLGAQLDAGTAPTNLLLTIADPGLLPGEYSADVVVSSPDAINSPQTLEVVLTVLPRPSLVLSTITPVPASIEADGMSMSTITVRLNDLRGAPITTGQHVVTLSATTGSLSSVVNNEDGTYTAVLTSTTVAERSTITGTVNGDPLLVLAMVDFVPGPPDPAMSTIDAAPLSIVADGVTTSTVTVQVIDVNGNLHTTGGETVTLMTDLGSLGPVVDVGDGTYTSILKSATTAGTATIVGTVDGSAITDDAAVDFVPGLAAQLSITLQPGSPSRSGAAFSPQPAIQVEDAFGNAVSQSGVSVTAVILTGAGTLGGTLAVTTNASGVAAFTDLMITGLVGDRTLQFGSTGLTSVTPSTINITAGVPTQLAITTQPSASAPSGLAFGQQPTIQLRDSAGNAVSQSSVSITAAIQTGGGTLGGTLSATTNASGLATFTDLMITGTVGSRTLQFSSAGLTSVTSSTIDLTAGVATQLTITTQPSASAPSGSAFGQQLAIQLRGAVPIWWTGKH